MRFVSGLLITLGVLLACVTDVSAASAAATAVSHHDLLFYLGSGLVVFGTALSAAYPTLLDFDLNLGPDGRITTRLIELLNLEDEILDDIVAIEANEVTGHQTIVRTGIPAPTWRKLYQFVAPTKTTEVPVRESIGMCENYLEVDMKLADLQNDRAAFMLTRARGIMAGFNKEVAAAIFYANDKTEPEKFMGLAPRFNSLSAENGQNIVDGLGTTNLTSIWLCNWGPDSGGFIYPKGSSFGLKMEDLGRATSQSTAGLMEVYRSHFKWDIGVTIADWRHFVRGANIKPADLVKNAATGADLIDIMVQMLEKCQQLGPRAAFYCNRGIRSYLRRQMLNKSNVWLSIDDVAGRKVMTFGGVPVRRCDSILNTETQVT